MITSAEIARLVAEELEDQGQWKNRNRIVVSEILVIPRQIEVTEHFDPSGNAVPWKRTVWLVGEERVEGVPGYRIVFSEEDGFGLAGAGFDGISVFGWYGGLLDVFDAM